jgi:hypothetical protein
LVRGRLIVGRACRFASALPARPFSRQEIRGVTEDIVERAGIAPPDAMQPDRVGLVAQMSSSSPERKPISR